MRYNNITSERKSFSEGYRIFKKEVQSGLFSFTRKITTEEVVTMKNASTLLLISKKTFCGLKGNFLGGDLDSSKKWLFVFLLRYIR